MPIEVTPHGRRPIERGDIVDALDAQTGDMFVVADGASSEPATRSGLVRIYALTTCRVRVGQTAYIGARMTAGAVEVYWLGVGDVIACSEI